MTLNEAEEMKGGAPEHITKRDSRMAITRYGMDRFTLLNAGIPNDDITRLYKSLYVHTQGFLNVIKEVTDNVKETQNNPDA